MEPKEIPKAFLHESLERGWSFFLKNQGHCPYIGYHVEELPQVGRKALISTDDYTQAFTTRVYPAAFAPEEQGT
jgi:hypothetical protein